MDWRWDWLTTRQRSGGAAPGWACLSTGHRWDPRMGSMFGSYQFRRARRSDLSAVAVATACRSTNRRTACERPARIMPGHGDSAGSGIDAAEGTTKVGASFEYEVVGDALPSTWLTRPMGPWSSPNRRSSAAIQANSSARSKGLRHSHLRLRQSPPRAARVSQRPLER